MRGKTMVLDRARDTISVDRVRIMPDATVVPQSVMTIGDEAADLVDHLVVFSSLATKGTAWLSHSLEQLTPSPEPPPVPRRISALGRDLLLLRAKLVASGLPLLAWDEIEEEVRDRRGGVDEGSDEGDLR